ncbi:hypothetical protein ACTQ49_08470 [Luteococcus sp. Sow4_B9]|uniref:hypothetical protein n=1 Tax=Luteococcus sp. Sow4_B9 TaxID=3438792 RepID=UPI003F966103
MSLRIIARGNRLASMGQSIVVEVNSEQGMLRLGAPFYRRSIPLAEITSVTTAPDDGLNRGVVNWFVVGRAQSPQGVRLNTGGSARVDITTATGGRYQVVVDTPEQAGQVADALRRYRDSCP